VRALQRGSSPLLLGLASQLQWVGTRPPPLLDRPTERFSILPLITQGCPTLEIDHDGKPTGTIPLRCLLAPQDPSSSFALSGSPGSMSDKVPCTTKEELDELEARVQQRLLQGGYNKVFVPKERAPTRR
jgi:hypothetical protein